MTTEHPAPALAEAHSYHTDAYSRRSHCMYGLSRTDGHTLYMDPRLLRVVGVLIYMMPIPLYQLRTLV
jgi:hypothetical protein